jgi:hypothetical protein
MRTRNAVIAALGAAVVLGCSDYGTTGVPPQPPPAPVVLLKDIEIPNLPSPYYHFEYGSTGRLNAASFASGFTIYDVTYDGDRIHELANTTLGSQDRLDYVYDEVDRVKSINYVHGDGTVFTTIVFTYDGRKLSSLVRRRKLGSDFVTNKTMAFAYYADGNVRQITEHFLAVEGIQTEATLVDLYENYDSGINVDGFSLLHTEFFDHLVLLPGAPLQIGNPGRVTRTGDGDNYHVDYTYVYDDRHRPLSKAGDVTFTTGPFSGRTFQTSSRFTYY